MRIGHPSVCPNDFYSLPCVTEASRWQARPGSTTLVSWLCSGTGQDNNQSLVLNMSGAGELMQIKSNTCCDGELVDTETSHCWRAVASIAASVHARTVSSLRAGAITCSLYEIDDSCVRGRAAA